MEQMIDIDTTEPNNWVSHFPKPGAYVTHNATQPLTDTAGGSVSYSIKQYKLKHCYFLNITSEVYYYNIPVFRDPNLDLDHFGP